MSEKFEMEYAAECSDEEKEKHPYITIFDLGKYRGVKEVNGSVSAVAFIDVGLPFIGGCESCGASCAACNMCPTKTGNCLCLECVHDGNGFRTVDEANRFCFPEEYAWLGVGRVADKTEPDQCPKGCDHKHNAGCKLSCYEDDEPYSGFDLDADE